MLTALPAYGTWIDLNGVTLCMSEWELEFDGGPIDVTTFCDGGYSDTMGGVRSAKGTIRGFWRSDQNPHDDPPFIVAGETLADLSLGVQTPVAGSPFYNFPVFLVTTVRVVAAVRDALKLDFDFVNRGTWTYA